VIVGGGWSTGASGGALAQLTFAGAEQRFPDTGFRCAVDAPPAEPLPLGFDAPDPPRIAAPVGGDPIRLRVAAWPHYADPRFARAFQRRYLEATGIEVRIEQTVTVGSNDEFLPLLKKEEVDLVTPSCDMALTIIRSGLVQEFELGNEDEMLPAFRRPPFLQHSGQGFGACYASGPMWLVSLDPKRAARSWSELWNPAFKDRIAIWDDGVWAVTLAALDLGLSPVFNLPDAELPKVQEHLEALLRNGCKTWRSPKDALQLVREQNVILIDDWGLIAWELQREGSWVHQIVPEGGSALWIDSWMIARHLEGDALNAARAWVEYAVSPENQRDLLLLVGYDPTNRETVRVLDKATAITRLQRIRERELRGLERWRPVPRRERYLRTWAEAKTSAGK
jgi:spermidine/putrescine transport system substrate-binding protein